MNTGSASRPRIANPRRQHRERYGQPQLRRSAQKRVDRDLPLQAGEGCAQAIVGADSECQVLIRLACDVERVRVRELPLVPIGGADGREDDLSARDHH